MPIVRFICSWPLDDAVGQPMLDAQTNIGWLFGYPMERVLKYKKKLCLYRIY